MGVACSLWPLLFDGALLGGGGTDKRLACRSQIKHSRPSCLTAYLSFPSASHPSVTGTPLAEKSQLSLLLKAVGAACLNWVKDHAVDCMLAGERKSLRGEEEDCNELVGESLLMCEGRTLARFFPDRI